MPTLATRLAKRLSFLVIKPHSSDGSLFDRGAADHPFPRSRPAFQRVRLPNAVYVASSFVAAIPGTYFRICPARVR
jgi:hypothetical protein